MYLWDIKNRDHGQTLDEAFLYWDYLFSGIRREEDGSITQTETILPRTGDTFAFAVADGFDKAWLSNRVISMKEKAIMWNKLKYHGLHQCRRKKSHRKPNHFYPLKVFTAVTTELISSSVNKGDIGKLNSSR